jgi:hypothetical protein
VHEAGKKEEKCCRVGSIKKSCGMTGKCSEIIGLIGSEKVQSTTPWLECPNVDLSTHYRWNFANAAIHCKPSPFQSSIHPFALLFFYVIDLSSRLGARYFPFFVVSRHLENRDTKLTLPSHGRDDQDLNGPNDSPTSTPSPSDRIKQLTKVGIITFKSDDARFSTEFTLELRVGKL